MFFNFRLWAMAWAWARPEPAWSLAKAQAWIRSSLSCSKPGHSHGFQAKLGLHITTQDLTIRWKVRNYYAWTIHGSGVWMFDPRWAGTTVPGIVLPPRESATSPEAISPRACCTCLCSHWWAILRMITRLFSKALHNNLHGFFAGTTYISIDFLSII